MCEVTWNTWESVSVVLMPIGMKASCIEALLSLVCFLLLSASLDCFPCSDDITLHWLKFLSALIHVSSHLHGSCALCVSLIASTSPFTSTSSSSLWSPCSSFCPSTSSSRMWWTNPLCNSAEDLGTLAENEPPTGYEPNDHFITEAYVEYTQESSTEQRFPNDFDYDDVTIGKTLLDACRRRADHSEEEGLSSCLSSSVSHDRTRRPVVCSTFDSQVSSVQETQRHNSESEQIRILLERQREQILADCQAEIRKHSFQADYEIRSIQKLNGTIESQKEEICRAHQGDERRRQDHTLFHEQLLKQNWDLREAHEKSLNEMEELKRFQGSTFDTIARINLSKIEILSLNSLARYRNHRLKSTVWTIREIFKMLNQYAVDILTLPVNQCLSLLIQFLVEC